MRNRLRAFQNRYLAAFFGILVAFNANAQPKWAVKNYNFYPFNGIRIDSVLVLSDTSFTKAPNGSIAFQNHAIYVKDTIWKVLATPGGVGVSDGNNYPGSISFTDNLLTLTRNGLGSITASFDSSRWHTYDFYNTIFSRENIFDNDGQIGSSTRNVYIDGSLLNFTDSAANNLLQVGIYQDNLSLYANSLDANDIHRDGGFWLRSGKYELWVDDSSGGFSRGMKMIMDSNKFVFQPYGNDFGNRSLAWFKTSNIKIDALKGVDGGLVTADPGGYLSRTDTFDLTTTNSFSLYGNTLGTYWGTAKFHYDGGMAFDYKGINPYTPNRNEFTLSPFSTVNRISYDGSDTAYLRFDATVDSAYANYSIKAYKQGGSYKEIVINPSAIDFKNISTDNTATQVLGKDASGHSVWRDVSSISGGGGITTMAAIGSSSNANGASISGVTLTLQPASGSFGGVVTSGSQTFGGLKSFNNGIESYDNIRKLDDNGITVVTLGQEFSSPNYGGSLVLRSVGGNSNSLLSALSLGANRTNRLPNANGTLANSVTVNGTNYTSDANGVIDIGTISGGTSNMSGLSDVSFTSLAANDFMKYDGSAWKNRTPANVRTDLGLVIGTNVQAFDADLSTYAGITPSANVQSLLGAADYSAMRTQLGLVIGTNVQAYDADLTTYAAITPSANVQSVLSAANYSAIRTLLSLVPGTDVQAYDGDLNAIAALSGTSGYLKKTDANTWALDNLSLGNFYYSNALHPDSSFYLVNDSTMGSKMYIPDVASNKLSRTKNITDTAIYYNFDVVEANLTLNNIGGTLGETKGGTGQTTYTQGDILYASAANTLSKLAKNTSATRYLSNTGTSNNPAWAQIDLSNGVTGILPMANGGTGANLSDPAANKILGWDDTDNSNGYWTLGSGLSYDHATHTLSATGGGGGGGIDDALSVGQALTASRSIPGATFQLSLGTSGSKLSNLPIYGTGFAQFNIGVQYGSGSATDADYTASVETPLIILPTITANRALTLPSSGAGKSIEIINQNTTAFRWTVSSVVDATGTSVGDIPNGTRVTLMNNGTNWVIGVNAPNTVNAVGHQTIKVYQALGSAIKAATVGVDYQAEASFQSAYNLTDGRCQYVAVWLDYPATITGVGFYMRTQGSYTADQTNQVGLFKYSAGTMTQVAASTNNGNLWKATANTWVKEPFSSTYYAQPGLYYVGFVYNSSAQTTAPAISTGRSENQSNEMTVDFTNSATLAGRKTGTALPSSQTMATLDAATPERPYVFIY